MNIFLHLQSWRLPSRGLPKLVLSMAAVTATTLLLPDLEIILSKSFQTESVYHTSALKEPATASAQVPMPGAFQVWCCDLLPCFPDAWRQRPRAASFECWDDLVMLSGALCPSKCFFSKAINKGRFFIKYGIMEAIPASPEPCKRRREMHYQAACPETLLSF